jgi:hypothetical protein
MLRGRYRGNRELIFQLSPGTILLPAFQCELLKLLNQTGKLMFVSLEMKPKLTITQVQYAVKHSVPFVLKAGGHST